jgi:hypothetical protein
MNVSIAVGGSVVFSYTEPAHADTRSTLLGVSNEPL